MIDPLSRTELKILRMLCHGFSYQETARRLGFMDELVHAYTYRIRKKTGIKDTSDAEACKAWVAGVTDYIRTRPKGPTRAQLNVMALLAQGKSYPEIARLLEIRPQCVQNHAHLGCRRAGIIGQGHFRTIAIQQYLATLTTYPHTPAVQHDPQPDPLDDF